MGKQQTRTSSPIQHTTGEFLLGGALSIMLVFTGVFAAQKAAEGASAAWDDVVTAVAQAEHSLRTPGW